MTSTRSPGSITDRAPASSAVRPEPGRRTTSFCVWNTWRSARVVGSRISSSKLRSYWIVGRLVHGLDHRERQLRRAGDHEHRTRVALGPVDRHVVCSFVAMTFEIGSHRGWPEIDASRLRTPDLDAIRVSALLSGSGPRPTVGLASRLRFRFDRIRFWAAATALRPGSAAICPVAGILACGQESGVLGVAEDEVEIARVDEEARALTQNEDGIATPERVEQEGQSAADREIPEGARAPRSCRGARRRSTG